MMVPGVEPIRVEALPDPCRRCTYWELRKGRPGTEVDADDAPRARMAKEDWWRAAALEWGPVGFACRDEGLRGYVLLGPSHRFPRAASLGGTSADALLLAQLWTADADDEETTGALLRTALLMAGQRGLHAVEAFGSVWGDLPCHPRAARLEGHGFVRHRAHPRHPLLRLDLRQTPGLLARVREALERVPVPSARRGEVPTLPSS